MTQLFARVELRGTPGPEIYQQLHEHLRSKNWLTTIVGTPVSTGIGSEVSALPHATYQAQYENEPVLSTVANELKSSIESYVWTRALVLVVQSAGWAETAG